MSRPVQARGNATVGGAGARFSGTSLLQLSVSLNAQQFPRLTVGAWIRPKIGLASNQSIRYPRSSPAATVHRVLMSSSILFGNNDANDDRAVFVRDSGFVSVAGTSSAGLPVAPGRWSLVAVSFDSSSAACSVFSDGAHATYAHADGGLGRGRFQVGGGSEGFAGDVRGLFVFADALDDDALRTLTRPSAPVLNPVAGGRGYALSLSGGATVSFARSSSLAPSPDSTVALWLSLRQPPPSETVFLTMDHLALSVRDEPFLDLRSVGVLVDGAEVLRSGLFRASSDWLHVAASHNTSHLTLRVNGSVALSVAPFTSPPPSALGSLVLGSDHLTSLSIDNLAVFNTSVVDAAALMSRSPLPSDPSLRLLLDFNEGFGIQVRAHNGLLGVVAPLANLSLDGLWTYSSVPLREELLAEQDASLLVPVLASVGACGGAVSMRVTGYPSNGDVLMSRYDLRSLDRRDTVFPARAALVEADSLLPLSDLVYAPRRGFHGLDSLTYQVVCDGLESSPLTLAITVDPVDSGYRLDVGRAVVSAEMFAVADRDAWETGAPLAVRAALTEDARTDSIGPSLFSLGRAQGVTFERSNELGVGEGVQSAEFSAHPDDAEDALVTIAIQTPAFSSREFSVALEVSDGGGGASVRASSRVDLTVSSVPTITQVYPNVLVANASAEISVVGYFLEDDLASCVMDGALLPLTRRGSSLVSCDLLSAPAGVYRLWLVTTSGVGSNYQQLTVREPMRILSLAPAVGLEGTALSTVISLAASARTVDVYCVVNGAYFLGERVSDVAVRCPVPPSAGHGSEVSLAYNTLAPSSNSLTLEWIPAPTVLWVDNSVFIVSDRLSQWVRLFGMSLSPAAEVSCLIGNVYSRFESVSSTEARCLIPPTSDPAVNGPLALLLSINFQQTVSTGVVLRFMTPPQVTGASPLFAPASGGSTVLVRGDYFDSSMGLRCVFGNSTVTTATVVNSSFITCSSPEMAAQYTSLSVQAYGLVVSSSLLPFVVYEAPVTRELQVAYAPRLGGTDVAFTGERFLETGLQACVWTCGDAVVVTSVSVLNSLSASCASPAIEREATCQVSLTWNQQDRELLAKSFLLFDAPNTSSLSVSSGPTTGGTAVVVSGEFSLGVPLTCVFGSTRVPAARADSSSAECVSPATAGAGTVRVGVLYWPYANAFASLAAFDFYAPPALRYVLPSGGDLRHLSSLTVFGTNFLNSSSLVCSVGGDTCSAEYVSSDEVLCDVSSLTQKDFGDLEVRVSGNGLQFTSPLTLLNWPSARIDDIRPKVVAAAPSVTFTVTGEHFRVSSNTFCVIGGSLFAPVYATTTTLVCTAPAVDGEAYIGVSHDGGTTMETTYPIEVVRMPIVVSLSPSLAIENSPTRISVGLSDAKLLDAKHVSCKLQHQSKLTYAVVAATVVGAQVTCADEFLAAGDYSLALILDDVQISPLFNGTTTIVRVSKTFAEVALTPSSRMPLNTSHLLGLSWSVGPALSSDLAVGLSIADQQFDCAVTGEFSVICPAVVPVAGLLPVMLSVGGTHFGHVSSVLVFPPAVVALVPSSGPTVGSTLVSIRGIAFRDYSSYECFFGNQSSLAWFVSSFEVACRSAPALFSGSVDFSLHVDDFEIISSSFAYYVNPSTTLLANVSSVNVGEILRVQRIVVDIKEVPLCVFNGMFAPPMRVSDDSILCRVPLSASVGEMLLDIAPNGVDATGQSIKLNVVLLPVIKSVYPDSGFLQGGATITVLGENFTPQVSCYFGATRSNSTFLSESMIVCDAPPSDLPTAVDLRVSFNRNAFSQSAVFTYLKEPVILSTYPTAGPESGGTKIFVRGVFSSFSNLQCVFVGRSMLHSPCTQESENVVSCLSPASFPGKVDLLLQSGDQLSTSLSSFYFYVLPTASKVHPAFCSNSGGCSVVMYGANFLNTSSLSLRVDGRIAPASWLNSTALAFRVHELIPGSKQLSISNNGYDFESTGLAIGIREPSTLLSGPSPSSGPLQGGTLLSFALDKRPLGKVGCVIGGVECAGIASAAAPLNYTCLVPPASVHGVLWSSVVVDDMRAATFPFFQYAHPRLLSASPSYFGEAGGVTTISGVGFFVADGILCRVGTVTTVGRFVSESQVMCDVPPASILGTAELRLSFNSVDFTTTSVPIQYVSYSTISLVSPSIVDSSGEEVLVHGTSFSTLSYITFGGVASSSTELVNSTVIRCRVPSSARVGSNLVQLAGAGAVAADSEVYILVLPKIVVSSLSPYFGPASGGTEVAVSTAVEEGVLYYCRFGDVTVSAAISESGLICTTPPLPTGRYLVSISANEVNFHSSLLAYEFLPSPRLAEVFPATGSEEGGALIHISGADFGPRFSTYCAFDGVFSLARSDVDGVLACEAPQHAIGVVELRVSSNLQQLSDDFLLFEFTKSVTLLSVSPAVVHVNQSAALEVSGLNFMNLSTLSCILNGRKERATFVSPSKVVCPGLSDLASVSGSISVDVSNNGVDSTRKQLSVRVAEMFSIVEVSPSTVTRSQSSNVLLSGAGFLPELAYSCLFGSAALTATVLSDKSLSCAMPRFTSSNVSSYDTLLTVAHSSVKSLTALHFRVLALPNVLRISPAVAPESGDWRLVVHFDNPLPVADFFIKFGSDKYCELTPDSLSSLSCRAPDLALGTVEIGLSVNAIEFDLVGSIVIVNSLDVVTVSPDFGYSHGNQTVALTGKGMDSFPSLCCEFDGVIVAASVESSSLARCTTPPHAAGVVALRVLACDISTDDSAGAAHSDFEYIDREVVYGHLPGSGVMQSAVIKLRGLGFDPHKAYQCVFFEGDVISYSVSSLFVSPRIMECQVPRQAKTYTLKFSESSVSPEDDDGVLYSAALRVVDPSFEVEDDLVGLEIGGYIVKIRVLDSDELSNPACKFADAVVPATIDSSDSQERGGVLILCVAPPMRPSTVELAVSPNGLQFRATNRLFRYVQMPQVLSMYPFVLSPSTETVVFTGVNFDSRAKYSCVMGSELVAAAAIDNSSVSCGVSSLWKNLRLGFSSSVHLMSSEQRIFTRAIIFLSASPSLTVSLLRGSTEGGSIVVISNVDPLLLSANMSCSFGSMDVPALPISATSASCTAPATSESEGASLPFSIKVVGSDIAVLSSTYTYYVSPLVTSAYPDTLYESQPGAIALRGRDFSGGAARSSACRVGLSVAELIVVSDKIAICVVSSLGVGLFSASISLNGQNFVDVHNFDLHVLPSPFLERVSPLELFQSQELSRVQFAFTAESQLGVNSSVLCYINSSTFYGAASGSEASCRIAPKRVGTYSLDIRLAATGQTLLHLPLTLKVIPAPVVESVSPAYAFRGNRSTSIFLSGSFSEESYQCVFSSSDYAFVVTSLAVSQSDSLVECNYDGNSATSNNTYLLVGVKTSGSEPLFLSSLLLVDSVLVDAVFPLQSLEGAVALVGVSGQNLSSVLSISCRIGGHLFESRVVNASYMQCLDVALADVGSFQFELLANDHVVSMFSSPYEVLPAPIVSELSRLCPRAGAARGIAVQGSGFSRLADGLRCRVDGRVDFPTLVNDSTVVCPCPAMLLDTYTSSFSLAMVGAQTTIASTPLQYFGSLELVLAENSIIVGFPTSVAIDVDFDIGSTEVFCLTSTVWGSSERSIAHTNSSTVSCQLSCLESEIGEDVFLSLSLDLLHSVSVRAFRCTDVPTIVKATPSRGVESLVFIVELLVSYPIVEESPLCLIGSSQDRATPLLSQVLYRDSQIFLMLTCEVPPQDVGVVALAIRFGSITTNMLQLTIDPMPVLSSVAPSRLPRNFNDTIVILASFSALGVHAEEFSYEVGLARGSCAKTSDTTLSCQVSTSRLSLGNHSIRFYLHTSLIGKFDMVVYDLPSIIRVEPSAAVVDSVSPIKFILSAGSLDLGSEVFCSFGATTFPGIIITSSSILCVFDRISRASVGFATVSIGDGFMLPGTPFSVHSRIDDVQIYPTFGSANGGVAVEIRSSSLLHFVHYVCEFGANKVNASFGVDKLLTCISPQSAIGSADFTLSIIDVPIALNSAKLKFLSIEELVVLSVSPSVFVELSYSEVFLLGVPHNSNAKFMPKCRFDSVVVRGVLSPSNSSVVCQVPRLTHTSSVSFSVSVNGVEFYPRGGLMVEYSASPVALQLSPWHGPSTGGTHFHITGSGFPISPVTCDMNGTLSHGLVLSSSLVRCVSSEGTPGYGSPVSLLFAGQYVASSLYFQTDFDIIVKELFPNTLYAAQSSQHIYIVGEQFREFEDLICRVGNILQRLVYINATHLLCEVQADSPPGTYDVFVSLNSVDFVLAGSVNIEAELMLHSLSPLLGPQTGYTHVTVFGSAFDSSLSYVCEFGPYSMVSFDVTSDRIRCLSPSSIDSSAGVIVRVVCTNTSRASSNSLIFAYTSKLAIGEVRPLHGLERGGTVVTIPLLRPPSAGLLGNVSCKVGLVPAQCVVENTSLITLVSPRSKAFSEIFIALNGVDFESTGVMFEFVEEPHVTRTSPLSIVVNEQSKIRLFGVFNPKFSWACLLGNRVFKAARSSEDSITCLVLASHLGSQTIFVSANSQDWTVGGSVQSVEGIKLVHITPAEVWRGGGDAVFVSGYLFEADETYSIQLTSRLTGIVRVCLATFVNSTALAFTSINWPAPVSANEDLDVTVSSTHQIAANDAIVLSLHPDFNILNIHPSVITFNGGAMLSLAIDNATKDLSPRVELSLHSDFDFPQSVDAAWSSVDNVFTFRAPAASSFIDSSNTTTLLVFVRLVFRSGYRTAASTLSYFNLSLGSHIESSLISEEGGDITFLSAFWPRFLDTTCRLGTTVVPRLLNSTEHTIVCRFGKVPVGIYSVAVSPNNGAEWLVSPIEISTVTDVRLLSISPSLGPIAGSTNVSLRVTNGVALNQSIPFCRFNAIEVPAVQHTATSLSCVSPAVPQSSNVSIEVYYRSPSGRVDLKIPSKLEFFFHESLRLVSLSPKYGSATPGKSIVVSGDGFVDSGMLAVRFKDQNDDFFVADATFVSSTQIVVTLRDSSFDCENSFLELSITLNGVDFSEQTLTYFCYDDFTVSDVRPTSLFEYGGTTIFIAVSGMTMSYPNMFRCRFGNSIIVEAHATVDGQIACVAPPYSPGNVSLDISSDAIEFTRVTSLLYNPVPEVLEVFPLSGLWTGGTKITLKTSGVSLGATVYCKIGESIATGTITSPSSLTCLVPGRSVEASIGAVVSIVLSFSPLTVIDSRFVFVYSVDPIITQISLLAGPTQGNKISC